MSSPPGKHEHPLQLWTVLMQRWKVAQEAHETAMKLPVGSEGPEARAAAAELATLKKQINDLVAEMQNRRAPDGAQLVFKVLDETPDESAVETATSTRRHR